MIAELQSLQAKFFSDATNTVTRLIPSAVETRPSGALATLSDIFRRPRLPIGYVALAIVALVTLTIGIWYFARARPHQPNVEAQRLYETGANAIRAGSYFQASKALELATRADDQFALAHARLAEAFMELDYFDKAKDEILRASELTPNRSVLSKLDNQYLDALTATVRRNFPAAVATYAEIVKADPTKAEAHVDLGRAYEKNNQTDKAIESYAEAIKRDPQIATQALELAQANQMETMIARGYIEAGNVDFITADYASAERDFQQGLDYAQKFGARLNEARAQLSLASLYEQRGDADKALTYQEPAQKFYQGAGYRTETNQAMNIRARLYRRKGDFKSALTAFEDQLKFAEETSDQAQIAAAHTSIGNLLSDLEKYSEALQHFEQSYQIQKSLNNQLNLGYALLNRGGIQWNLGHQKEAGR